MMTQITNYNRQILQGDVLDKLKEIPNNTFDCIISSPPYWGLRNYQVEGQLGLESDFRDYLKIMSLIMDELKRVLKPTGSCWINLGDTYASDKGAEQIIAKSRFGIPERFYINCIDSGWIARNNIPWYKSNAMPQSVKDRFTNKWESVFFFVKEQKYYFNLNNVREKSISQSKPFNLRVRENITGKAQQKMGDFAWTASDEEMERHNRDGTIKEKYMDNPTSNVARLHKDREGNPNKQDSTLGSDGKPKANYAGFNDRWNNKTTFTIKDILKLTTKHISELTPTEICNLIGYNPEQICVQCNRSYKRHATVVRGTSSHENYPVFALCNNMGKNPGDVFFINPKPFSEAHFATFPVELPEYILKCACPQQVCIKCGIPRYSISKPTEEYQQILDDKPWKGKGDYDHLEKGSDLACISKYTHDLSAQYKIIGYTKCSCNKEFIPGIVLDPFMGAGTTAVAAEQLGLRWCGIELKEEYCSIAKKRLESYVLQERIA